MTYIELIVVLSIFAVLSSVVLFNYGSFQSKVDLKNLASDVALQIVQAQKSALSGLLPAIHDPSWKPSYGVYFNSSTSKDSDNIYYNGKFLYFAATDNYINYDASTICTGECISKYTITKNDYISNLSVFYQNDPTPHNLTDLSVIFIRPNSGASLFSTGIGVLPSNVSYVQITVTDQKGDNVYIRLYPPGRVEVD